MKDMLKKLSMVVGALVLLGAAGYGTYYLQQQKVDDLTDKNAKLTQQVSDKNKQLTDAKQQSSEAQQTATTSFTSRKGVKLQVFTPLQGETVSSPLYITGIVPGSWSFEASFPLKLVDSQGAIVAQTPAKLLDDWMTPNPVPFNATLSWSTKPKGELLLVLEKDNPSGLSQNEDSLQIQLGTASN